MPDQPTNPLVPVLKIGNYVEYWMTFPFQEEIVYSKLESRWVNAVEPAKGVRGSRTKRGPDMVCDIVKDNEGNVTIWLDVVIDVNVAERRGVLRQIPAHAVIGIVDKV